MSCAPWQVLDKDTVLSEIGYHGYCRSGRYGGTPAGLCSVTGCATDDVTHHATVCRTGNRTQSQRPTFTLHVRSPGTSMKQGRQKQQARSPDTTYVLTTHRLTTMLVQGAHGRDAKGLPCSRATTPTTGEVEHALSSHW